MKWEGRVQIFYISQQQMKQIQTTPVLKERTCSSTEFLVL